MLRDFSKTTVSLATACGACQKQRNHSTLYRIAAKHRAPESSEALLLNPCFAAIGLGQERDRMDDPQRHSALARAILNLQQTTGIAGGDSMRSGHRDVIELAMQKLRGHFRLH